MAKNGTSKTKTVTPRRATLYSPAAKKPKEGDLGPQAQLVYDKLVSLAPVTVRTLGESFTAKQLDTKQDPVRVVGYYIQQFIADGFAKGKAPKAAVAAA